MRVLIGMICAALTRVCVCVCVYVQVYGRYNWTLGAQVAAAGGRKTPYLREGDYPTRVIALHPSIDLSRTRTWQEFATVLGGLIQVCAASLRFTHSCVLSCK